MSGGVHDPLITANIKPPSPRGTGIVFTVVALIVAVIFRRNAPVWISACAVAAVLAVLTVAKPSLLGPLNRAWFKLGLLLNRIVNPVVMLLMFLVAFVPTGFLMRIWRDPLLRRRRPEAATYWVAREPASEAGHSMKNQF
jgi:hypothetical protein